MRKSALLPTHSTALVRVTLLALGLLLATASCVSIPNPYGFRRGPYLQLVTPHSVLVVWDSAQEEVGRVEYGPTEALGQVLEETHATRHHAIELTGLSPYSTYYYRVGQSPVFPFRSGASPDQTRFRFAVIGDTQTYHQPHQAIIAQILATKPDWFIHLGDMNEHGESAGQLDDFFGCEAPLQATAPFFTTIGNHQRDNANYYNAFHLPGNEHWYSFSYGHTRFICLEGDNYPEGTPLYTSEELAWLEAELSANTSPWLFVFQHHPLFTSASEETVETEFRSLLQPLLERYGVDVFLSGHKHNYERVAVNGITYIVSGGGGGRLTGFGHPEPLSQKAVLARHFVLFEVDGEHLTGTAIDIEGNTIDRFALTASRE